MTISSTGTGNITLASAVAGYQSFLDAGVSDGDQIRYIVEDNSGADWEIGTAAVSNNSTVLVRTVEESSAANNAALSLTSSATVFIGVTANDLDNAAPIFTTTPPTSVDLVNDGSTAVTLNAKAYDESGIPVQYSWDAWASGGTTIYDASSLPPQFASAPSINQSTGVYSFVGSNNESNEGTINFRVKASDGVKIATHVAAVNLEFLPQRANLLGQYDYRTYNTSDGSTLVDLSGNSNNLSWTNSTATGAGYLASGNVGEKVWATGNHGSYIEFAATDLSSVKTFVIIFDPQSYTSSWTQLLWHWPNASSTTYAGYFSEYSSDFLTGQPVFSGLTADAQINGNAIQSSAVNARSALETSKFNSLVFRNYDLSGASKLFRFTGNTDRNHNLEIRAILMFSVSLTDAEIRQVHENYPQMATWDGA